MQAFAFTHILFSGLALVGAGFLLFHGLTMTIPAGSSRAAQKATYVLAGFLFAFALLSLTTVYAVLP